MTEIDMKGNPFFLDEEGENWVLDTWKNMSLEQKCGQVFCPMGFNGEGRNAEAFYPGYSGGWSDVSCRQRGKYSGYL